MGYAYDAAGRLASMTYPGGNVAAQTYTPRGQIAGIDLDGGTLASYEYNPVGATTAKNLENGLSTLYRYDAAKRLVGLEHRRGLDLLAKIDYTLDRMGNRRSKTQSVLNPLTENYNYDAVDQLIEAKYGAARTVGYQYDAVGNRQWVSDNGTTAHYTANSDNGYTSVGGISTQTDLNGNMVSVPGAAYVYDAQNRLTSATVNGVRTEFTYDSRNRVVQRVSKRSVGGRGLPSVSTLNLTYSGWNLIEERNAWGQLEQVYAHGAGIDELLLKITTGPAAYYHHDGLGSTIALTGENGELLESYRYDAFGAATVYDSSGSALPASPRGNRFLFTGREWLSQVGLYDYRNRVYSAQIGRFLQTDPIRFAAGDVNIYRYCGNDPANSVDPMGLCKKLPKPGDGPNPPRTPTPPGPGGGGGGGGGGVTGWFFTLNAGAGTGFQVRLGGDSSGFHGFVGVGVGIGLGVSGGVTTGEFRFGDRESGLTGSLAASGGVGPVGGQLRANVSNNFKQNGFGKFNFGGRMGIGIGAGATFTGGWSW